MDNLFTELAQQGVLGIILVWFMWRNEGVMKNLIETVDGMKKAIYTSSKVMILMSEAINHRNGNTADKVVEDLKNNLIKEIDQELQK